MPNLHYMISKTDDDANIVVFVSGQKPLLAHSSHGMFGEIEAALRSFPNDAPIVMGESELAEFKRLFDVAEVVASRFMAVSERVSVSGGTVYFDGDPIDNSLTRQIVRFLEEEVDDWQPLVCFMENVAANPNDHSREQLYEWLARRDFTITEEGYILGYKGVRRSDAEGVEYESISSGPGIVDGVSYNGHLPNNISSIVEIARSKVHHDPSVGCSTGLHVGTWDYAHSFGHGVVLKVEVNPRDVVSVPTDCDHAKVRCCRYQVVEAIAAPITSAYEAPDEDFLDEEECECGLPLVECGSRIDCP